MLAELTLVLATVLGWTPDSEHPAKLVPAAIDFGPQVPCSSAQETVWLINRGDTPISLTGAKPGCRCLTVLGFESSVVQPGSAIEIPLHLKAPAQAGTKRSVVVTFRFEDHEPLKLPVHLEAAGPDD